MGCAVGALACFADPYALTFVPAWVLLSFLTGWREGGTSSARFEEGLRLLSATVVGGAAGAIPYALLRWHPRAASGPTGISWGRIPHNFDLLVHTCLPWALSTKVYVPHQMMDYAPWDAGPFFPWVQGLGALVVVAGFSFGGGAIAVRTIPWAVRRLGFVGFSVVPVTLAGFLLSVMVMDHFSTRYLVACLLVLPLALAPLAYVLGTKKMAWVLLPYLVSAGVAGWMDYTPFVCGYRVTTEPGGSRDDYQLFALLRSRGVHVAVADYWVAYRSTFLAHEDPVVAPTHASQDRYAPYRKALEGAPQYAYVYDPLRSEEDLGVVTARLEKWAADAGKGEIQRVQVGRLTAFILPFPYRS